MISLKKINNCRVKPIKVPSYNPDKIKGYELFSELYSNIFLLAKKKSGKTNCIFKIIKKSINKNTNVIIFCSTVQKDSNWIEIIKWLKQNDINFETYTSIFDEDKSNIVEMLAKDLENQCNEELNESSSEEEECKYISVNCNKKEKEEEKKYVYKPKKIAPEFLLIFDDLSTELRSKYISGILKKNRHLKMKIILSSQYSTDLEPQAISQLDYMLIFKGIPETKLEIIHKQLDLSIDYIKFKQMYEEATKDRYNFYYIDVRSETFRKNFDKEFEIN